MINQNNRKFYTSAILTQIPLPTITSVNDTTCRNSLFLMRTGSQGEPKMQNEMHKDCIYIVEFNIMYNIQITTYYMNIRGKL